MNNFDKLEKIIGYTFKNKELILKALTHSSSSKTFNYERMEFLGDSLLSIIVAEYLYLNTEQKVGKMSVLRSSLVSAEALSKIVLENNLKQFIIVGKSIKATNHIANNVLADVFESITAAIYLDGGFEETKKFVSKFVLKNVNGVLNTDYKTFLQEKIASLHNDYKIEYKLINSLGPSHELTFEMAVCLNGKIMATAKGKNKKEAEQLCAKLLLEQIEKNGLNS